VLRAARQEMVTMRTKMKAERRPTITERRRQPS
jgi:hypothetical protein